MPTIVSTTDDPVAIEAALKGELPGETSESKSEEPTESKPDPSQIVVTGPGVTLSEPKAGEAEASEAEASEAEASEAEAKVETKPVQRDYPKSSKLTLERQKQTNDLLREKALAAQEKERADGLDAKNKQLETDLAAAKAAPPKEEPKVEAKPAPKQEDYEDFDKYLVARDAHNKTQWLAESEAATKKTLEARDKEAEEREKTERERVESEQAVQAQDASERAYGERYEAARNNHDDFDTVMEEQKELPVPARLHELIYTAPYGPELAYTLVKDVEQVAALDAVPLTDPQYQMLKRSPHGLQVLEYLRDHPDEAQELAAIKAPGATLVAMGELQGRVIGSRPASASRTTTPSAAPRGSSLTTKPKPVTPLAPGLTASTVPLGEMNIHDFMRTRNREEAERRQQRAMK